MTTICEDHPPFPYRVRIDNIDRNAFSYWLGDTPDCIEYGLRERLSRVVIASDMILDISRINDDHVTYVWLKHESDITMVKLALEGVM